MKPMIEFYNVILKHHSHHECDNAFNQISVSHRIFPNAQFERVINFILVQSNKFFSYIYQDIIVILSITIEYDILGGIFHHWAIDSMIAIPLRNNKFIHDFGVKNFV